MNTHELNEDLLTRYALGELTQDESLAVKEALMANPEARKTVAEIEATVGMLTEALGGEAVAAGLGDEAKEKITTEAQRHGGGKSDKKAWGWGRRIAVYGTPLLAACVVIVAVLPYLARSREAYAPPGWEENQRNKIYINTRPDVSAEATAATEGLPTPQPEPLRYSQAQPAEAAAAPSTPRTEADAVKEKKNEGLELGDVSKEGTLRSAGVAGSETPPQPSPATSAAAGSPDPAATPTEGLQLKPADTSTPSNPEEWDELDVNSLSAMAPDPAANAPAPPKPEPKAEPKKEAPAAEPVPSIARVESIQSMPASPPPPQPEPKREIAKSAEAVRQLEALGYLDQGPNTYYTDIAEKSMTKAQVDALLQKLGYSSEQELNRHLPELYAELEVYWRARRSGEQYNPIIENPFKPVANEPLSTFSIDVDTGSYANVRRFIEGGQLPPADAVRIEELINYFDYTYPKQTYAPGADPFTAAVSVAACPWTPGHKLVRVGVQGAAMPEGQRPASNLVFLIDVSGSMDSPDKLPLLQQGLQMLVNQLGENDRVSMVVYAGRSGVALPPTNGSNRQAILDAIRSLESGGSTNGAGGITLAYQLARENFIEGGVNRVILATDGDFNVGISDQGGLIQLITEQAKSKVFLTVLGFGTGNLQDGMMEQLANKGNGMYAYIDSLREAKKVFVEQAEGSLITIAKDVKIQIEFNPSRVQSYRLIGYEKRALAAQDFNDDTKDAGEIGAGHTVTALYEIVPVGGLPQPGVDPLKYQQQATPAPESGEHGGELMTLKLRYKQPEGDVSKLLEFPIVDSTQAFEQADADFRFASSVAVFGMLLRGSQHSGAATFDTVQGWAMNALGDDPHGYRAGFLDLVRKAGAMR